MADPNVEYILIRTDAVRTTKVGLKRLMETNCAALATRSILGRVWGLVCAFILFTYISVLLHAQSNGRSRSGATNELVLPWLGDSHLIALRYLDMSRHVVHN